MEVISRESTDKDSSVSNCDHGHLWIQGEYHAHMKSVWILSITILKWSDMQKNHVKRNTTTQVIAGSNLNWIWLLTDQETLEFLCTHAIDRKYMEQVTQCKKNYSIWINGLKDTAIGIWIWIWIKFKFKSAQKFEKIILC